jgi:heterodisulfide reductase subunit A-like polyferredoxin
LCRREAGAYLQAMQSGDEVVVACTQEQRLFTELAAEAKARPSVLRFVNIREMGGWSKDAKLASPKIAALLAAAQLSESEPVATVLPERRARAVIGVGRGRRAATAG